MTAPPRTLLTLKRSQGDATAIQERLHKVLANAGLGSRRLLEQRIQSGEIKVNGNVAELGSSVHAGDRVEIDNKLFVAISDNAEHAQVLVFNKPEGVVTTRDDPEGRPTVFEQLPQLKGARWIAVGRLDINTTGLLLLTTDGDLAHRLMHPSAEVEREYICRVHGEVADETLAKLGSGVDLEDGPAKFEELAVISRGESHSWFRVVIREGRNREVRRMWESQGLMVSRLKRIRYGNIELPRGLLRGQSQTLDAQYVKTLRELVGAGSRTPTLTLQAVIGQRRAGKSSANEFRPAPRTQQAWTGAYNDEAREIRAFDRIREDKPFGRPGDKRKRGKKPARGGNGPNPGGRGQRGARGPRTNASGQTQIGIYQPQPQPWRSGPADTTGAPGRRPPGRGRKPRPGGANTGWRPPVTGSYEERNANSQSPGNRGRSRRTGVIVSSPLSPDKPLPRDDIGNRIAPDNTKRGPRKPRKPHKPRTDQR